MCALLSGHAPDEADADSRYLMLSLYVTPWHELATILMAMTLPLHLRRMCVISWHELGAATLTTTTL